MSTTDQSAVEQLRALSAAWMDAWKTRNVAQLEQILAPEFCLVVSSNPERPVKRAQWLELAVGGYDCEAFAYKDQNIRVFGDFAIVASVFEQRASVKGTDRSGEFFLTDVWRKHGSTWQVIGRYSSRPEARTSSASAVVSSGTR